jgi:integrase
MARAIRNRVLDSRSRRLGLVAQREPYWQTLQKGLALGYYRPASGGDGSWWGRVRANGRYTVEALATADDHAAADGERILDWAQAQTLARAWAARQTGTGPLTVAEAVRTYLDDLRARKGERAATDAEGRLKKYLPPVLGDRLVADLTDRDLRAWRNGLVSAGGADPDQQRRQRDTANRVLGILRAALNLAFRDGRIGDDRAWRRVEPFKNAGAARKVLLDPIQLQMLINACGLGLRELVAVGAQTGARLGELTGARVRDLDLDASTLKVAGKTGEREIHLAPATTLLLRRAASGKSPDAHLLSPPGHPAWTKGLHRHQFETAVRKAGLDPATCFYSLRHSYISHALKNLVPIKAVADHCGTGLAMLQTHYAKILVGDKARYAALATVDLQIDGAGAEVVRLRGAGPP